MQNLTKQEFDHACSGRIDMPYSSNATIVMFYLSNSVTKMKIDIGNIYASSWNIAIPC
jgi:hypothetical protein